MCIKKEFLSRIVSRLAARLNCPNHPWSFLVQIKGHCFLEKEHMALALNPYRV